MPYAIEEPVVRDVRRFFYEKSLIVPFDWGAGTKAGLCLRSKAKTSSVIRP